MDPAVVLTVLDGWLSPGALVPSSPVRWALRVARSTDSNERRLEYQVGPRRTEDFLAFSERLRILHAVDGKRRWILGATEDVHWGEVLPLLDVLAGLGVAPEIERPHGLRD